MRYFFDTEFMEDGKTIELISIGIVRENGETFYAENSEADLGKANPWVRENVIPHLKPEYRHPKNRIAVLVERFVNPQVYGPPEFWAYYADYDWVVLCQLYGTMLDLPDGWPMLCLDLKQEAIRLGITELPKQFNTEHMALDDARWNRYIYEFLQGRS